MDIHVKYYLGGMIFVKKWNLLFIILMSLLFNSCSKEQSIADFSVNSTYGTAPMTVNFSNTSLYADKYSWDFGTGDQSSSENPTYTYENPGTYTVTLTASNDDNSDKKSLTINVAAKEKPIADFSFDIAHGVAPCKVKFVNSSTRADSYSWEFGNGDKSTEENPPVIYTEGGTYTVTLTANGPGGTNKITKNVTIKDAPTKLQINSITLKSYPPTRNDGTGWDPSDGPDLYIELTDSDESFSLKTGYYSDVIKSNLPLNYTKNFPWTLFSLNSEYIIKVMDYETLTSDEFVGGYYFTAKNKIPNDGSKYPDSITLSNTTSEIELVLNVEWVN